MKKLIFGFIFATMLTMSIASCNCGGTSTTTDSTEVDTVLVDSTAIDSVAIDSVAVDTTIVAE